MEQVTQVLNAIAAFFANVSRNSVMAMILLGRIALLLIFVVFSVMAMIFLDQIALLVIL